MALYHLSSLLLFVTAIALRMERRQRRHTHPQQQSSASIQGADDNSQS